MSEEKKNLNKKEMTEEELNKVAGGIWYAHDEAKYDALYKKWQWAIWVLYRALDKAKSSGDPVAIQKAQEAYDAVQYDKTMWTLCDIHDRKLHDDSRYDQEKAARDEDLLKFIYEEMDYQHYMDWFNSITG